MKYKIKNWEKFQHYKDRNPPWIKLHFDILCSSDWVMLDDSGRLLAIVCMLIASRNDGFVDVSDNGLEYIKRLAYLTKRPNVKPLISCGFLVATQADVNTFQADASICYNMLTDARPETETETETETEGEIDKCACDALSKPSKLKTYKQWNEQDFLDDCNRVHEGQHILPSDQAGGRFFRYWTECDTKGRMKFQKQPTWDTLRRMCTWRDNLEKYEAQKGYR